MLGMRGAMEPVGAVEESIHDVLDGPRHVFLRHECGTSPSRRSHGRVFQQLPPSRLVPVFREHDLAFSVLIDDVRVNTRGLWL